MSVLVKGMEIPNNCGTCPLRLAWCRERLYMVTRPPRCPLIELPDHGDLIDRDKLLKKKMKMDAFVALEWVSDVDICLERTVIPAERDVKVCPLYSDDEVTEYCVEGPCTDEMEGRCPIAERSEDA